MTRAHLAETERAAPIGHRFDGGAYGAIFWYQGESDTNSASETNVFTSKTDAVLDGFQAELDAPVILAQLGRRGETDTDDVVLRNVLYQRVREAQRTLATGAQTSEGLASTTSRPDTFLVVTHDLPMAAGDGRHLSAEAQEELGRRVALAVREHLWGEDVDGSGPRLEGVEQVTSTRIEVHTDRTLTPPASTGPGAYDGYFAVFSGGSSIPVTSVTLKPLDASVIVIQLGAPGPDAVVRYMPPPGSITDFVGDVVRAATCAEPRPGTTQCLPLPAFGASADASSLQRLQFFFDVDPLE